MYKFNKGLVMLLLLAQIATAQNQEEKQDGLIQHGRYITAWELMITLLAMGILCKLFGTATKKVSAPKQPTLTEQLTKAIGQLHTTEDGTRYGTALLEAKGDRFTYGSVTVVNHAHIRAEERALAARQVKRAIMLMVVLFAAGLVFVVFLFGK